MFFKKKQKKELSKQEKLFREVLKEQAKPVLKEISEKDIKKLEKDLAVLKKLKSILKVIFPGFLKVFSTLNTKTSLAILDKYPSPDDILNADKNVILESSKKSK